MARTRIDRLVTEFRTLMEESSGRDLSAEDPGASFTDLGFDSLELTQAALAASKKFGVKMKLKHLAEEHPSVRAVAAFLDRELPAAAFAEAPAPAPKVVVANAGETHLTPAPAPVALPTLNVADGSIQALVQQQLVIMARQLEVLAGSGRAVAAAATIEAPVEVKAAPAVIAAPAEPDAAEAKPHRHGPQLVIDRSKGTSLSPTQERHLQRLIERYTARTRKSKEFTQRNRSRVADPRTVAGFKPRLKELVYPIVVERSSGCRLWDLDGNEYVDLLNGYGSNFFGYGAPFVRQALAEQMERGMEIGPQTPLIDEVSALVTELTGMERVAFCNTGSEAVLATLRMARTVTGRDKIVMFAGGYHGMFDEVVVRGTKKRTSLPAAPGIPKSAVENMVVLDWAAPESLAWIREHAQDVAGVIVEPVQSRMPEVQPVDFLRELRALTTEIGSALIFDEVVTGFRVAPGGAQELFGIRADLASYGKVVGGGLSVGIVAGKPAFMDALDGGPWQFGDDSIPEVGVTYFAGTFVRHPLHLAVARAALLHMKQEGPALQRRVNDTTTAMVTRVNELLRAQNAPLELRHFSSVVKIAATADVPYGEIMFHHLRERGLHLFEGRPSFLTAAHGPDELAHIERAFAGAIEDMQEGGFYPRPVLERRSDQPPVPGARLGRDKDGHAAWFVPDPQNPSRYTMLGRA